MTTTSSAENELWLRFFQNDVQAQVELFQEYKSLVDSIAAKLKKRLPLHVRMDDLQSAGQEALWKAMHAYSLDRAVPFGGFASTRIRGAMIDELRRMDDMTRTQRAQLKSARSAYEAYHCVQTANVSLDDVQRYEWIVDDTAVSPEESAIRSSEIADLNKAIIRLSEQEQLVLSMVFVEGLSLAETAEVLSLSRSRVSTVYSGALKSLKGSMLRRERRSQTR